MAESRPHEAIFPHENLDRPASTLSTVKEGRTVLFHWLPYGVCFSAVLLLHPSSSGKSRRDTTRWPGSSCPRIRCAEAKAGGTIKILRLWELQIPTGFLRAFAGSSYPFTELEAPGSLLQLRRNPPHARRDVVRVSRVLL